MTKEEIHEQAELYAIEATCGLNYIKGFPLSADQIHGFLKIFVSWKVTAEILYEETGQEIDPEYVFASVCRDLADFIDTDIPLHSDIPAKIIMEYTTNKFAALYIMKNEINTINEMHEARKMLRQLIDAERWDEIHRITEIDILWQER